MTQRIIIVQSLSHGHVWLFAAPWIVTGQASLSFTISRSLLKCMSIESVMSSNHLVLCCPLLSLYYYCVKSLLSNFNRHFVHVSAYTHTQTHSASVFFKAGKESAVYIMDNEGQVSSAQFSRSVVSDSLRPHESQHIRPPYPSPTPGVHSDSHPSSQWCHPAVSSSVVPFLSCPQSLAASKSFPMSQLLAWGGQSTGVSALASFLPKKSQGWFPSEWTGWISLQPKGLSRVFSNTTVQRHQFFSAQLSL